MATTNLIGNRLGVVLTCHNRCAKTIACLTSLFSQQSSFQASVYLVDDGCTDGTRAEVALKFPSVKIIDGNGHLYWGGGMRLAMQAAQSDGFDYLLWLNDDVVLVQDALTSLSKALADVAERFDDQRFILVGPTKSLISGQTTYSGYNRTSRWHPARYRRIEPVPGNLTACDTFNGNIVLVSGEAYKILGPIDSVFPHQIGDTDYGYRAQKKGIPALLVGTHLGICESNPPKPRLRGESVGERLKAISSPLEFPMVPWLVFLVRHGGALGFGIFLAMAFKRYRDVFRPTG